MISLKVYNINNLFNIMNQIKRKTLTIKELSLWDENARFPDKYFSKTEEELIAYFCEKKDFKIIDLANEIVKDFDLPQVEKIIVYNFNNKNIVLEGNRRLAVYKLLHNPALTNNIRLKSIFLELKNKININENFVVECLITKDKEQGFRYIDRKHLRGNNEVSWGDNERAHHNARRGTANQKELLKVEITKLIKELDFPEELKEKVLGPGYVTTFWRMLEQSPSHSIFGFAWDKNGILKIEDKEFKEKLKVIIFNVLQNDKFNNKLFSRLNVKEIKDYLKQISLEDSKKVMDKIKKQTTKNLFGKETIHAIPLNKKSNPKSSLRDYLIPKTCILQIQPVKINNIYCELRNDLLLNDSKNAVPNAVGVLFRVFLEISLDYYAKKNGYEFKKTDTISQKIPWVITSLKAKGHNEKIFNNINKVGSSEKEKSYLSIHNFHEYIHSGTTQPTSSELKAKWDNLQEFFEILWQTLNLRKD